MAFTANQEKQIVLYQAESRSHQKVRCRFLRDNGITGGHQRQRYTLTVFKRVWDRFRKAGVTEQSAVKNEGKITDNQQIMDIVVRHFNIHPNNLMRIAANDLRMSPTTTWWVAKAAKPKPYKPFKTHLIPRNLERSIIFSDEKFWITDVIPNSQNQRTCAVPNPRNLFQCRYQGKAKALCWVGILKDPIIGPFWFVDQNGVNINLNQESYLDMLQTQFWPAVQNNRGLRWTWFHQTAQPGIALSKLRICCDKLIVVLRSDKLTFGS